MGTEPADPAFIQDPNHRPKPTPTLAGGIPLISLSPLAQPSNPKALSGLIADVEAACRDWGFFQVVDHGVSPEILRRVQSAAKEFFDLSVEEKGRVRRDEVNPLGYYDTEHTKNVRDWKEVFDFVVEEQGANSGADEDFRLKNQWPDYPPELRQACEEYAKWMEELAYKLLELIALTLKLPAKRLNGFFKDQTNLIRLNHYPPCPFPHLALGVGRHKDPGALTILSQDDVGGLEVKRKSDGEWVRVKPIPNSYVINVGDIIQVWSNDKYESPEHRVVVNSERERFSIPLFFNPGQNTIVVPLEEVVVGEGSPARYTEYKWGDFLRSRKNSNFKKLEGENLQIYHFRKAV